MKTVSIIKVCTLCKWKICAVVVWETEPRVKRPLRRHFEMENSTVAVMLQHGGCELVVGFKKRFIVFVICYTGQFYLFFCLIWSSVGARTGLHCAGVHMHRRDPRWRARPGSSPHLLQPISEEIFCIWWLAARVAGVSGVSFELNWELNTWTHIWILTWIGSVKLLFVYWVHTSECDLKWLWSTLIV